MTQFQFASSPSARAARQRTFSNSRWLALQRLAICWLVGLAVMHMPAGKLPAQSLWPMRHPDRGFPLHDLQAREIGDTVTVLITENTGVQNKDERDIRRSDQGADNFDFGATSAGQLGTIDASANLDSSLGSTDTISGDSEYKVNRVFTDTITALVVDKLPNGNLVIYGTRHRIIAGERRTLKVSGIARQLDIRSDNTIPSNFLANFTMAYVGTGEETQFSRAGWLRRKLNAFRLHDGS